MTLIGPWVQWTPHAPARNLWNLSDFVTGTYANIKKEYHHHQIGMEYLYDTAKWNYIFAYDSASRIDRQDFGFQSHVLLDEESNYNNEKSLCRLVNSEFKMVTTDTNRTHSFCQILTFMTIT